MTFPPFKNAVLTVVLGSLLIAAPVLLPADVGTGSAQAQSFPQYCQPMDDPEISLILIDNTEIYDRTDAERFAAGFNRIFHELTPGALLEVYLVGGDPGTMTRAFSACIPGCTGELARGESNWEHICGDILVQRDKRDFVRGMSNFMTTILNSAHPSEATFLIDTFDQLAHQYEAKRVRQIRIFSDMLEFSPLNWKINGFDEEARLSLQKKSKIAPKIRNVFREADIHAFGFGKRLGQEQLIEEKGTTAARLPAEPSAQFRTFWEWFFSTALPARSFQLTLDY